MNSSDGPGPGSRATPPPGRGLDGPPRAQGRGGPVVLVLLVLSLLLATSRATVEAQRRPPRDPGPRAVEIGPRIGLDYRENVLIVGGQLRIPVDPWRRVELLPSFDFTFETGITERQLNLDAAVYFDGGRSLYVGGGAAFRNTIYPNEDGDLRSERETRTGYTIFGGLHGGRAFSLFVTQLEFRWSFVDPFEPRSVSLGLNYPIPLGS